MKDDFLRILEEHARRYPLMEPQDVAKLAYQGEFGPEHLVSDRRQAGSFLMEEWKKLPHDSKPQLPESVGGGLCRFPLSFCQSTDAVGMLAELFILTAGEHRGSMEGLAGKLEQTGHMEISGIKEWMEEWRQRKFPPVHHSRTYHDTYHPHYRLIQKEYADYFFVLLEVDRLVKRRNPAVIGIDGRCGSGKTYLAEMIGKIFSCNVLHMDDYYLPPEKRQENWMELPGGNMDLERFFAEALHPLSMGRQAVYAPYHCKENRMGKELPLMPEGLTVVEGSYSCHPLLAAEYDLTIFLTCTQAEQRRRLQMREGSYFTVFEKLWMPMEENYFKSCRVETGSRLVVDTSGFFGCAQN